MGHIPWLTKQRMKMVFWFFHDYSTSTQVGYFAQKKVRFGVENFQSFNLGISNSLLKFQKRPLKAFFKKALFRPSWFAYYIPSTYIV